MNKRSYNIFFDLHTVSGITIAVLTYVIFFAGSFAFFRDETANWERNEPVSVRGTIDINVATALDTLSKKYTLHGRDIDIHRVYDERRVTLGLSQSTDTLLSKEDRESKYLYMDPVSFKTETYRQAYSLGEFLYRLHFFAQIPYPVGYYLSGFTALFLLFAVVTGVLVHWKKIISNFYVFRPREKLKTVWTDAHTVIGTLGLPFQIVYAVTGTFFMINIVLVAPSVVFFYNGDAERFYDDMGYAHPHFDASGRSIDVDKEKLNNIVMAGSHAWSNFDVNEITLVNYGDENMHVAIGGVLKTSVSLGGIGQRVYKYSTGELVKVQEPFTTSYLNGVKVALYRLHFGDYGGIFVKSVSFILGLLGCFVVITGILIWLEARNKKDIPPQKKKFNHRTGVVFLAICLSMYPVTAFAFIAVKIIPVAYYQDKTAAIYLLYFVPWLLSSILFIALNNNYVTNRWTLLSGGVLGFLVPVSNGIATGNWFWKTFAIGQRDLFVIDVLWLALAAASFYAVYRMDKRPEPGSAVPSQNKTYSRRVAKTIVKS